LDNSDTTETKDKIVLEAGEVGKGYSAAAILNRLHLDPHPQPLQQTQDKTAPEHQSERLPAEFKRKPDRMRKKPASKHL
jgi:hypothetical protein